MNFRTFRTLPLLVFIVAVVPTTVVAAEQEPVDCEALARYIQSKMGTVHPHAFTKPDNELWLRYMQGYGHRGYPATCPCRYSDKLCEKSPDDYNIRELSDSLNTFARYQGALMRCVKTSCVPCPVAEETIQTLQQKKVLASQCQAEYHMTREVCAERQRAAWEQREQQKNKGSLLDNYIQSAVQPDGKKT